MLNLYLSIGSFPFSFSKRPHFNVGGLEITHFPVWSAPCLAAVFFVCGFLFAFLPRKSIVNELTDKARRAKKLRQKKQSELRAIQDILNPELAEERQRKWEERETERAIEEEKKEASRQHELWLQEYQENQSDENDYHDDDDPWPSSSTNWDPEAPGGRWI